ncbi:twin-arginine translocase subunit TatC [Terriglobus albidus]|uniref:twin-arginine translocase subunit TatC n=1 Tax=Terriglobus albidus TaxID=1592106 RepID=UPI0021DFE0DE|nr:twin-arginine translocase subunit TatC [Terriglobus albidus]
MADVIDRARAAVTDRAELPGMSLMEHLDELRKRLIRAVIYLVVGMAIAYAFHERLYDIVQKPLTDLHLKLNFTHPTDGLNLSLKTALYGGAILAAPFILYQVWLFIAPGLYQNEKKYVTPFMVATVGLFLAGAWFGYRWVLPEGLRVLILGFGKQFNPIITIEDYTNFFLAVILGLGACFELPVLIFFLALFGIVDAKFLWKNVRYAVMIIFVIAAVICPTPDPFGMCLFASPMLALYFLSIFVAYMVHPKRREAKAQKA